MLDRVLRALVIAPHPDDEVLGCGGTIARLGDMDREAHVAIITRGRAPLFSQKQAERCREEAGAAHHLLGVARTHFLDFPAAELDRVPHAELNGALTQLIATVAPDTVFLPFNGDIHLDHQLVFNSVLVASRPNQDCYPLRLYAYETLSETNWHAPYVTPSFVPNTFVDVASTLERKIEAMRTFRSQLCPFPSERSVEALRALAIFRGATVHRDAAEAFVLLREVG